MSGLRRLRPVRLLVCDLDDVLLGDRVAEASFFEAWLRVEEDRRPLLAFCSTRQLEELRRILPHTNLPPANLVIGAAGRMLLRFSFWQHAERYGQDDNLSVTEEQIERLLATAATNALDGKSSPDKAGESGAPPDNERELLSATLSHSGLLIELRRTGAKGGRDHRLAHALKWVTETLEIGLDRTLLAGGAMASARLSSLKPAAVVSVRDALNALTASDAWSASRHAKVSALH